MARKRIIYQSEALYAGSTGEANPTQIHRVQDVSHSVEVARTDVNEFGKLAALSREVIETPTVSLDFSYYTVDGKNENTLGFNTDGNINCISGIMSDVGAEKNYYILTVPEGQDATQDNAYSAAQHGNNGVIGVGNGFITSYTLDASVGEIPSASISVEASNLRFDTSSSGFANPAIDFSDGSAIDNDVTITGSSTGTLSAAAIRPGDITVDFGTELLEQGGALLPGMSTSDGVACVQSISIDLPLSRTPLQCLGSLFPKSRELDLPINASLTVSANLSDIASGTLSDLLCSEGRARDISVTMKNRCGEGTSVVYTLKGAQLDSQAMSSSIGDNKTVDLTFSAQLGGPQDTTNGVFISGSAS
jgi:hypothetical protein|tara:strand:- start:17201 stop:18286 length:1086 start_codon:yes stop_codon:yes gene_type:complete